MKRKHRWIVFSTALSSGELMLACSRCDAYATVLPEDSAEWSAAYYAPSSPYLYRGNGKLKLRDGTKWCSSEESKP